MVKLEVLWGLSYLIPGMRHGIQNCNGVYWYGYCYEPDYLGVYVEGGC